MSNTSFTYNNETYDRIWDPRGQPKELLRIRARYITASDGENLIVEGFGKILVLTDAQLNLYETVKAVAGAMGK